MSADQSTIEAVSRVCKERELAVYVGDHVCECRWRTPGSWYASAQDG